jgi:hypothetical protein
MLSLLGFGKRRRSSTKSRKSSKKGGRKPPAALLKMCKKYRVRSTVKRGTKRVYKKATLLKKLCMRKKKMMLKKKKLLKKKKVSKRKSSRFGRRHRRHSKKTMMFGRRRRHSKKTMFGRRRSGVKKHYGPKHAKLANMLNMKYGNMMMDQKMMKFGSCGAKYQPPMAFGKRRAAMSKPAAMQAFKQFYRRYCRSSKMGGRFRFGNGGNPALSAGYEFCPSGMGGVLGANSTGLFPSPCTPMNAAQATAEANVALPTYAPGATAAAFGRRYKPRTYRSKCYGKGKSRYCLKLKPKYKDLYFVRERDARRRRI